MTAVDERPADFERAQRHNTTWEQIVLGAMMLNKDAVPEVTDILNAGDYHRPIHGVIHDAICNRYTNGEPTDPEAVAKRLHDIGELHRLDGGAGYLHTCMRVVPMVANATWYATQLAEFAGLRRLAVAAITIGQILDTPGRSLAEAQDLAGQAIYEAVGDRKRSDVVRLRDMLQPTLVAIEEAGQRKGLRGLSTGLIDLDKLTHGMQPGQLWIVAGRPGMGKSVFASDLARAVSVRQNRPVVFFTLEMSREELMLRFTAAETAVDLEKLQNGGMTTNDWLRVTRRFGEVEDAPLHMGDGVESNLMQIRSTARRIALTEGDLGLVIVDYLQLMPSLSTGRRDLTREREVAELSRGLKLLAKELRVPVIGLSQLNRGVEARADKRPNMADLRESGSIENDADVIILLYRPEYYEKDKCPRPGEVELIVEKNRQGRQDTVVAAAQLRFSRFVDMHREASH